jgi:hypothetical protein
VKIDRDKYVTTRKIIAIIVDQPVQFGNIGFENKLFKIINNKKNRLFICPITLK